MEKQYGVLIENALYSNRNKIFILGKTKIQKYPLLYYGIGNNTSSEHLALVSSITTQFRQRVLHRIHKNLYLGIELDFQSLGNVSFNDNTATTYSKPIGYLGSSNFSYGTGIVYDNRNNVLNVRKGNYAELGFLHSNKNFISDYSFTTFLTDNRLYIPLSKKNVLASQIFGQFNIGEVPFNQLSLMGGESLMRGYYLGRYRDKNLIASQVELRMLPLPLGFSKRIGASIFASTGSVYNSFNNLKLTQFLFAGGAGLRFLIFPKKDIYTRLDFAFTKEGNGFYIFIGEAF